MEYGSHISVSTQLQPSLLEVTAQESLTATLRPAFTHLTKVLKDNLPLSTSILQYSDELYAVLHALLQWHCLNTHDASFSEHFYGLKRIDLKSLPKQQNFEAKNSDKNFTSTKPRWRRLNVFSLHKILKLVLPNTSTKTRSLVVLVLLPYLQHKISEAYEDDEGMPMAQTKLGLLKQKFLSYWPQIHLTFGTLKFIYYFRYLVNISRISSLSHHLSGVTLQRRSEEDILSDKGKVSSFMLDLFMETLEMGAFFLQFLDWYYSTDRSRSTPGGIVNTTAIPPSPHLIMEKHYGPPKDTTSCPLCRQNRIQSTVLSVSGVVFCYSCILLHIREKGKCPVSGYPATVKQLIRIYDS